MAKKTTFVFWTPGRLAKLKKLAKQGHSERQIALALGCPARAVKEQKALLEKENPPAEANRFWSPEKIARLKELVEKGASPAEVGKALGCSTNAARYREHLLKIKRPEGTLSFGPKGPRFWTQDRVDLLKDLVDQGAKNGVIAGTLGCSPGAVNTKRSELGLKGPHHGNRFWTQERLDRLKELIEGGTGFGRIAELLDCSRSSVAQQARKQGFWVRPPAGFWTPWRVKQLAELVDQGLDNREISRLLGCSFQATKSKRYELKLIGPQRVYPEWTPERIDRLKELVGRGLTNAMIANCLGVSETCLRKAKARVFKGERVERGDPHITSLLAYRQQVYRSCAATGRTPKFLPADIERAWTRPDLPPDRRFAKWLCLDDRNRAADICILRFAFPDLKDPLIRELFDRLKNLPGQVLAQLAYGPETSNPIPA